MILSYLIIELCEEIRWRLLFRKNGTKSISVFTVPDLEWQNIKISIKENKSSQNIEVLSIKEKPLLCIKEFHCDEKKFCYLRSFIQKIVLEISFSRSNQGLEVIKFVIVFNEIVLPKFYFKKSTRFLNF